MKAFTYLIINKTNNKWYYGVRYAKGCKSSDLFTKYFSSCEELKKDIIKLGKHNFYFEIRKEFNDIPTALSWERKVLKRMKVRTNPLSYNKHYAKGFTIKFGNDNPSKRADVRKKVSDTKISASIFNKIVKNKFKVEKKNLRMYKNYLTFMLTNKPKCTNIIKMIQNVISQINKLKKKEYPSQRKRTPRGRVPKITDAKIGSFFYTNLELDITRLFGPNEIVPEGWIRGQKTKKKIESSKKANPGRTHSIESKIKMKESCKGKQYYTSPDLLTVKAFYNISDVPTGWIKGNKLKSRNDKISTYLKEVRHNRNEN